jgi:hypothetical protein
VIRKGPKTENWLYVYLEKVQKAKKPPQKKKKKKEEEEA